MAMDQILAQSTERQSAPRDLDADHVVCHFRQSLLWPLRLSRADRGANIVEALVRPGSPWQVHTDEFDDPTAFRERHYSELVTFLPPVRRFLYGEGATGSVATDVLRRSDIAKVRVHLAGDIEPVVLDVAHIDLYILSDIDLAMLNVELTTSNVPLDVVQDMLFQFGRLYPAKWNEDDSPFECAVSVEWLAADGTSVAQSDYAERGKYLEYACRNRTPLIAAHWRHIVLPLTQHEVASASAAPRFKLLEGDRLAQMAFVGMSRQEMLTRGDYVRLAFASGAGDRSALPFAERHLESFEADYCYDRQDERRDSKATTLRFMSSESAFVVVGPWYDTSFQCAERGYLGQFRHQQFLLFMIANFQKAALLMFSDRMAGAVNMLDIADPRAVMAFRTATRKELERFLRFTHRYWFQAVSSNELDKELFALSRRHLGLDRMYEDVRAEIEEMSQFLEGEAMRRQSDTMMRLTVVTMVGLILTIATGFLGMNVFDFTELAPLAKTAAFLIVLLPTVALMMIAVRGSRRLSAFLDRMSNDPLQRPRRRE